MLKFAFKDVSTKNSEPTYWTILGTFQSALLFTSTISDPMTGRAGVWEADDIVKFYIALLNFFSSYFINEVNTNIQALHK
jgi:hypothetical protein